MKYSLLAVILCFCLLAAGCGSPQATAAPDSDIPWPTQDWQTSTPEEQGMDGGKLQEMLDSVAAQNLGLHSLLVIRYGKLVSETYFSGYSTGMTHELYSVTKSFTGTLVGIALEQGLISGLDARVLDFYPGSIFDNPDARKDTMTVQDLLTMRSGLDWVEGDAAYMAMYNSLSWIKYVLDRPMATDPGTEFVYCSGCSHVLSGLVYQAAGHDVCKFADENLLGPLGITDYTWNVDSQGIHLGGWGMQLKPWDMAKLGYLYLHGGLWDGKLIVSKDWIDQAVMAHVGVEDGGPFGYQWWIYPGFGGTAQGGYAALGRFGQTILVVPDLDLVVVTTAQMDNHNPIFRLVEDYVIAAVKESASSPLRSV